MGPLHPQCCYHYPSPAAPDILQLSAVLISPFEQCMMPTVGTGLSASFIAPQPGPTIGKNQMSNIFINAPVKSASTEASVNLILNIPESFLLIFSAAILKLPWWQKMFVAKLNLHRKRGQVANN